MMFRNIVAIIEKILVSTIIIYKGTRFKERKERKVKNCLYTGEADVIEWPTWKALSRFSPLARANLLDLQTKLYPIQSN